MDELETLHEVIGTRTREIREGLELSQDETARRCRERGLRWSRSTLAAIEAGHKSLNLGELVVLASVLLVPLGAFGPAPDQSVRLTPNAAIGNLNDVLDGEDIPSVRSLALGVDSISASSIEPSERRRYKQLAPNLPMEVINRVAFASRGEAEHKAARRLGISPAELAVKTHSLWGHSLTEERESRLGEFDDDAPLAVIRGHRAHITRVLLEEIRLEL